ncbi:MAG TPA: NAD(P)-dependent oxidoreductase [Streptosporangiaceae bacterium]|nr:NAD(P)-dependent oxidoreductase [Streptosporangiaceae bacterium]
MSLLLPEADGVADYAATALPRARVLRYGEALSGRLDEVTFYCLPYMGDAASIKLIDELARLEVVQSLSSGVDDVLEAVPPHAVLCNGQGLGHEEGTADLAVALILASLRQIPRFAAQQARRTWSHARTESLDGQRVLLVGYGAVGAAIHARVLPFGASVSRVSRTPRDGVAGLPELPALAAAADILVVCIALHPATRGLVGREVLAALPNGALVVNVARGPVVDAAALASELAAGRLRAALDVTDPEPPPADGPEWTLPNVLITPHIGGDTAAFARRAPEFVAGQAARHLAGRPLRNIVRPALG